jgi:hypothetical protein
MYLIAGLAQVRRHNLEDVGLVIDRKHRGRAQTVTPFS